jgi:flagellar protein FliO/FliZ
MRAMDVIDIVRYTGALLLVLALIGLAGLAARRFGVPGVARAGGKRRLAVVETLMVGPRHKLYLLSRDGVEHLVLVGPQGANVVERGLGAAPPAETAP